MLCTTVVHNYTHTDASSSYSSLDWVLSHWVHFTVHRFICVVCTYFRTAYVVLTYCEHGGVDLMGLMPSPQDPSSFSAVTLLVGSFDL